MSAALSKGRLISAINLPKNLYNKLFCCDQLFSWNSAFAFCCRWLLQPLENKVKKITPVCRTMGWSDALCNEWKDLNSLQWVWDKIDFDREIHQDPIFSLSEQGVKSKAHKYSHNSARCLADVNFLNTCCTGSLKMLKLNGYFWHDLILIFQVSQKKKTQKTSQKIHMSEKPIRGPSELCWDRHGAASAQPLHGSRAGADCWLSPGQHSYLTLKDCTAYLRIPGRCLHHCTWYILQTTPGISFWRLLTGCECGDLWNLQDSGH